MPALATLYVCRQYRASDQSAVLNVENRVRWDDDDPHAWTWYDYADWYRMPHSTHHVRVVNDVWGQKIWAVCCFVEGKDEIVVHNYAHISTGASRELERWLYEYAGGRAVRWDCPGGPVR
jgi:hypothetical protein